MEAAFIFYFGPESVYSHWFKCKFLADGREFCCVEQYIMYRKALLFNDIETAKKILNSSNPARHRYLGRQVKGFEKQLWQEKCTGYAFDGNLAKFTQNIELRKSLLETGRKSLAEASPYDRNWGIGLSMGNPQIYDRSLWRGKNMAGQVLEWVRAKL